MGERLYPSIRKITTAFCCAIILLTIGLFALRMTALSDMVREQERPVRLSEILIDGEAFTYRIDSAMEFASPTAESNIMAKNSEDNEFFMRFEIIHEITDRSIYLSPFIAPGQSITSIYLQGKGTLLEQDDHRSIALVTVYDPANRNQLGSQTHPVTIRIR